MPNQPSATRTSAHGRIRSRPLIATAVLAVLLTLFTVGSIGPSAASLRDTTSGELMTAQAASIQAVSTLASPLTVQYSAGVMEKTGALIITNTGTIDATYRTVTTATGAAPLVSGVKVSMWPSTAAAGCATAAVNAIRGTWASFPALSGTLVPGGSQFYCVRSTLDTPVGHPSNTAVTAVFSTTLSRSNWTSTASSTVTQTFVDAAPAAPTNLTFSGTTSASTTLNWTPSTDDVGVTGYDVYRGSSLAGSTTGATSLVITGLAASTSYSFTVKAKDGAGHLSASSPIANVRTLAVNAPSGWFQLVNTKSQMCIDASGRGTTNFTPLVQWTCSNPAATNQQWSFSGPNAAGYYTVVPRHSASIVWDVELASNNDAAKIILYGPNSGTNQQWSVIAVGPDKYQFVARNSGKCLGVIGGSMATNAGFEQVTCNASDPAQTFSLRAPDTTAPTAPTSLTATATSGSSVSLKWSASTDNTGVTEYAIYRNGSLLTSRSSTTTFVDNGLAAGQTYEYKVVARDLAGNASSASNTVRVTLPVPVPALKCENYSGNYVQYTWDSPVAGDPATSGYAVYLNGSFVPTTVSAGWPVVQLYPTSVGSNVSGSIGVVVKQIRPGGTEVTVGTGTLVIGLNQWGNSRTSTCG